MQEEEETKANAKVSVSNGDGEKNNGLGVKIHSIGVLAALMLVMMLSMYCTGITPKAYCSLNLKPASYENNGFSPILKDFRKVHHTTEDASMMSWWDYEYQIRTTLMDNTRNNSHIALVGKAMSSNESAAYDIITGISPVGTISKYLLWVSPLPKLATSMMTSPTSAQMTAMTPLQAWKLL